MPARIFMYEALRSKTLMVFDDQVYYRLGDTYSSEEAHVLFMIGLSKYFKSTVFCSRLSPIERRVAYAIPPEIAVHGLPFYRNIFQLLVELPLARIKMVRSLWREMASWDILVLSWPHPLSLLLLCMHKLRSGERMIVLFVRQNMRELVKYRYQGLYRLGATLFVMVLQTLLKCLGKDVLIFTLSEETYREFRRSFSDVYQVALPVLSSENIPNKSQTQMASKNSECRLLYVGRIEPEKGLPTLVEALARIKKKGGSVRLDVVGSGDEEGKLLSIIRDKGLVNDVILHGYVPYGEQLFERYSDADVFVLPSYSEGTPNVLIEAMAFGLPVVASRVGGCEGVIKDRDNGILVMPGSAKALTEALLELIENPELRKRLSDQAKSDAQMWTMESQQENILRLIVSRLNMKPIGQ